MFQLFATVWLLLTAVCHAYLHNATVKIIHQYQPVTWVENLAIRPDGFVLPIFQLNTSSSLTQVNPKTGESFEIYDFIAAGNSLSSITAVTPDLFAVVVVSCSQTLVCTTGSGSIWRVDFRPTKRFRTGALVTKITTIPSVEFPNGMAALNDRTVLLADSYGGGLWSIDIWTGETNLLFTDPLMNATSATSPVGINGIRYALGELYFTNSAQNTLNRVCVDPITGHRIGSSTVVASGLNAPDDFGLDLVKRFAYVAGGRTDALFRISLDSGEIKSIAALPGPTSARFGINGKLYVSTNGDLLQGNYTMGGAIYEIEVY